MMGIYADWGRIFWKVMNRFVLAFYYSIALSISDSIQSATLYVRTSPVKLDNGLVWNLADSFCGVFGFSIVNLKYVPCCPFYEFTCE